MHTAKHTILATVFALLYTYSAFAGFQGDISFSDSEKQAAALKADTITETAAGYLEDIWKDHLTFYSKYGVSRYWGSKSPGLGTRKGRVAALKAAGQRPALADDLREISCVSLSLRALRAGFEKTNDPTLINAWTRIETFVRLNNADGCALIEALRRLGWSTCYWNPDPSLNDTWDNQERGKKWKSAGDHGYNYHTATKKGFYYLSPVTSKCTTYGRIKVHHLERLCFRVWGAGRASSLLVEQH